MAESRCIFEEREKTVGGVGKTKEGRGKKMYGRKKKEEISKYWKEKEKNDGKKAKGHEGEKGGK